MAFKIESKKLNLLIGASTSTKYQTLIYEDRDSNNLICKCIHSGYEEHWNSRRVPVNSMDRDASNRVYPYDSFCSVTHTDGNFWAFPILLIERACRRDNFDFKSSVSESNMTLDSLTRAIINWILRIELGQNVDFTRRSPYSHLHRVVSMVLRKHNFLVIAHPEIGLTPYSQSRLGIFLAIMANTRTLYIDTQSDNLFNGIRLAMAHNLLDSDKVVIAFYDDTQNSFDYSDIKQLTLRPSGKLESWPTNFFDQIEDDLSKI